MLKAIDPLLNPDLLYVLAAMGHGDTLAIVDSNFPIHSVAAETVYGEPLRLDGVSAPRAARTWWQPRRARSCLKKDLS